MDGLGKGHGADSQFSGSVFMRAAIPAAGYRFRAPAIRLASRICQEAVDMFGSKAV